MTNKRLEVTDGVDTHGRTHHGAALDGAARLLVDRQSPATAGYRSLLAWLQQCGQVTAVGVEATGTYGAGWPVPSVAVRGVRVVGVDRPNRKTRRLQGNRPGSHPHTGTSDQSLPGHTITEPRTALQTVS